MICAVRLAPAVLALLLWSHLPSFAEKGRLAGSPVRDDDRLPAKEIPATEEAVPPPDAVQCPQGSSSPEVFSDWYRRAIRLDAEAFEARHGHPPVKGELPPLLPEQIEANLGILCNCLPRRAGVRPGSDQRRPPLEVGSCVPSATILCIDGRWPGDRRFEVKVSFQAIPTGVPCGEGRARPLSVGGFNRGGLFWCAEPDNPELLIKLIDGCAANGHYGVVWSTAAGVDLTATVTDTRKDDTAVYVAHQAAAPGTDIEAFPCE